MFEISWSDEAFDQMQKLVSDYPSLRSRFAAALRYANEFLKRDPESLGESRERAERVVFFDCLTMYINLMPHSGVVEISRVNVSPSAV